VSDEHPVGQVLDGLGVTATIRDEDLIASAIVVLRVIGPTGAERLAVARSTGLRDIETAGLLHLASTLSTEHITRRIAPGA
jgi:hypothetical protein